MRAVFIIKDSQKWSLEVTMKILTISQIINFPKNIEIFRLFCKFHASYNLNRHFKHSLFGNSNFIWMK